MSVEGEAFMAIIDETVDDPTSYRQAMGSSDANLWQKAIDAEIGSMDKNSVWTLVDLPKGVKPIGSKWIFKRKRDTDEKLETYKAHLVAKGYHQCYGIGYDETFSPMAMLKSIRIILTIAAYMDYEI